jgi:hypothetical protein
MSEFVHDSSLWVARLTGSLAGVGISLVYLLPKSHREAASRFMCGMLCGVIFGGPTGLWLARYLSVADGLSQQDIVLAGSAAASLSCWWVLGIMARLASRYARKSAGDI